MIVRVFPDKKGKLFLSIEKKKGLALIPISLKDAKRLRDDLTFNINCKRDGVLPPYRSKPCPSSKT